MTVHVHVASIRTGRGYILCSIYSVVFVYLPCFQGLHVYGTLPHILEKPLLFKIHIYIK